MLCDTLIVTGKMAEEQIEDDILIEDEKLLSIEELICRHGNATNKGKRFWISCYAYRDEDNAGGRPLWACPVMAT